MVLQIKNALRTLKVSFGLENKNMKTWKKNDVLKKKKVYAALFLKEPSLKERWASNRKKLRIF